jgi:hypothetical protein
MGYIPSGPIQQAGLYLLSVLRADKSVRYSRFYDGRDETHDLLCQALGLNDDWYSAEVLMDVAADELCNAGIITIASLPELMSDGEHDYTITLTDEGKSFLRSRKAFRFHDVDL